MSLSLTLLCVNAWLFIIALSQGIDPVFRTTFDGFQSGIRVIQISSPTTSAGYDSGLTTITYQNSYTSAPSVALGIKELKGTFLTTNDFHQVYDLKIVTKTSSAAEIQFNRTSSTITQLSVNYMVCDQSSALQVKYFHFDLVTQILWKSATTIQRSQELLLDYRQKSNSTNAVVIYTTVGIYMAMKETNTFDFSLVTSSKYQHHYNIRLTVDGENQIKWIRICSINYEKIAAAIYPPYYMNAGFIEDMQGEIPENQSLSLRETGIIFTGITDFILDDANRVIDHDIELNERQYDITSRSLSRVKNSYMWYRKQACEDKHYLYAHKCYSCDYTCRTCNGPSNTSCQSCSGLRSQNYGNNSCPCPPNYIDVGSQTCAEITCPGTCNGCANMNACAACHTFTNRVLIGTECVCKDYFYDAYKDDVDLGPVCSSCHLSCKNCSAPSSQTACLSCNTTRDHRQFTESNNTCRCIDRYYEAGKTICDPCQYTCAKCTNSTVCTDCNAVKGRVLNPSTNICQCVVRMYDDGITEECMPCPFNCAECTNSMTCTACPDSRNLSNSDCVCRQGYYDDTSSYECQQCDHTCSTCYNRSRCESCNNTLNRYSDQNGQCLCPDKYFDDGVNQQCYTCHATCTKCTGVHPDNCTSCDSDKYRTHSSDNRCVCIDGFYQKDGDTELCQFCQYTCETCDSLPNCLTCNASKHRVETSTGICQCMNGYFDKGNQLCQSCHYTCLTCSSERECDSCNPTTRDTSDLTVCKCLDGFYDDGISSSCLICPSQCLTCTNGNNCTSCPSNKYLTPSRDCDCATRTYQPLCDPCHHSCQQCVTNATTCTQCNSTANRYLNSSSAKCLCYDGYFDDNSVQKCAKCHHSCQTCLSFARCSSCPTNRIPNGTLCVCVSQYYENPSNLNCLQCHYSCQECSQFSVCTACNATSHRQASPTLCTCMEGYYDNNVSQICRKCDSRCMTCSQYPSCTSCNTSDDRHLDNSQCLCLDGFYEDSADFQCKSCHYSCLTCDDGSTCLTCSSDRQRNPNTYLCDCNPTTYEDTTKKCQLCLYPCQQCTTNSTTCTSCEPTHSVFQYPDCLCPDSTFDNTTQCESCLPTCRTCLDKTSCQNCWSSDHRQIDSDLCVCEEGWHDQNGSLIGCQECHYSCQTCYNSSSCLNCKSGRVHDGSFCRCPVDNYFDDGVSSACQPCDSSCMRCENTQTNCTACSFANHRVLDMNTSTCACEQGYYDDGQAMCQTCHYSCMKCHDNTSCSECDSLKGREYIDGPLCECSNSMFDVTDEQTCQTCDYTCATCISTAKTCKTCPSSRNFSSASSSCPCETGSYDNLTAQCAPCLYACETCTNDHECTTCPSTRYRNPNKVCECKSSYYDIVDNLECSQCYVKCQECQDYDHCTSCDTTNTLRELSQDRCICTNGFYDDYQNSSNLTCQKCHYSCQFCVLPNQCTSCDHTSDRIYNVTTFLCTCKKGFYDDGLDHQDCQKCRFDCLTCQNGTGCLTCPTERQLDANNECKCNESYYTNGSVCEKCPPQCATCTDPNTCTSCNGNRTLNNSSTSCECAVGQYPVTSSELCESCHYTCQTCRKSTSCQTCASASHRYKLGKFCKCTSGYYDDLSNQQCPLCHYSCLTCSDGQSCETCSQNLNRVLDANSTLCVCSPGFYENPSSKLCVECHYSCLTCSDGSHCLTCNNNLERYLNSQNQQCQCNPLGYFDNQTSVCGVCQLTCRKCQISASRCTACDQNTQFRQLEATACNCLQGYYEHNSQVACAKCSYKCVTCQSSATQCTQCNTTSSRNNTPNCDCEPGFYDDNSALCKQCDDRCETCVNGFSCKTCEGGTHRSLSASNLCECPQNYYEEAGQIQCKQCDATCQTCEHPTLCLTCSTNRIFNNGRCSCKPGLYTNNNSNDCLECHYSCQTCSSSPNCSSCSRSNHRTFNLTTDSCDCEIGYYDTQNQEQQCQKCNETCLTCTNHTDCQTCYENTNKIVNVSSGSNYCICQYHMFEVAGSNPLRCQLCHYSCQKCENNRLNCIQCNGDAFRTINTQNQCTCLQNYYDDGLNQLCIRCSQSICLKCFGNEAHQCMKCDSTNFLYNGSCSGSCPDYYFEDYSAEGDGICKLCGSSCKSCTNASFCNTCDTGFYILPQNSSNECLDNCPDYYYQNGSHCLACQSPCRRCTQLYQCLDCVEGNYHDNQCFPCHSSCKFCNNASAYDCLTCVDGFYLESSICKKAVCGSNQYVDSFTGCKTCAQTYAHSLQCTASGISSCLTGYMLLNEACQKCENIEGYYTSANGECSEICGDGLKFAALCDDGNNLNGDGCSSSCHIEKNWQCSAAQCKLLITPTISLQSVTKANRQNIINVIFTFNVGVRIATANIKLAFDKQQEHTFQLQSLNRQYKRYLLKIEYYETIANNQLKIFVNSPLNTSRLLQLNTASDNPEWNNRLLQSDLALSIVLSLQLDLKVQTSPPAVYYSQQTRNLFSSIFYYILLCLHLVCVGVLIVFAFYRFKLMLYVIEYWNYMVLVYIVCTLGVYNISELGADSCRTLQPFIYPFGTPLSQFTSLYDSWQTLEDVSQSSVAYFSFTELILCVCVIQVLILLISICIKIYYSQISTGQTGRQTLISSYKYLESKLPKLKVTRYDICQYVHLSLLYTFTYEILLSTVITVKWLPFQISLQSSYSWGLVLILLCLFMLENWLYIKYCEPYRHLLKQIEHDSLKKMSQITASLISREQRSSQVSEKSDQVQQNPFMILDPFNEEQLSPIKPHKNESQSENKTQALIKANKGLNQQQIVLLYDLTPKYLTLEHRNIDFYEYMIHYTTLPLLSFLFPLLVCISVQVQQPIPRCALLAVIELAVLVYLAITLKLNNFHTIKLLVLNSLIFVIVVLSLGVAIINNYSIIIADTLYYDIMIVVLAILVLVFNCIAFIVSVFKSDEFYEYRQERNRIEIQQRNLRRNRLKGLGKPSPIKNILMRNIGNNQDGFEHTDTRINFKTESGEKTLHGNLKVYQDSSVLDFMEMEDIEQERGGSESNLLAGEATRGLERKTKKAHRREFMMINEVPTSDIQIKKCESFAEQIDRQSSSNIRQNQLMIQDISVGSRIDKERDKGEDNSEFRSSGKRNAEHQQENKTNLQSTRVNEESRLRSYGGNRFVALVSGLQKQLDHKSPEEAVMIRRNQAQRDDSHSIDNTLISQKIAEKKKNKRQNGHKGRRQKVKKDLIATHQYSDQESENSPREEKQEERNYRQYIEGTDQSNNGRQLSYYERSSNQGQLPYQEQHSYQERPTYQQSHINRKNARNQARPPYQQHSYQQPRNRGSIRTQGQPIDNDEVIYQKWARNREETRGRQKPNYQEQLESQEQLKYQQKHKDGRHEEPSQQINDQLEEINLEVQEDQLPEAHIPRKVPVKIPIHSSRSHNAQIKEEVCVISHPVLPKQVEDRQRMADLGVTNTVAIDYQLDYSEEEVGQAAQKDKHIGLYSKPQNQPSQNARNQSSQAERKRKDKQPQETENQEQSDDDESPEQMKQEDNGDSADLPKKIAINAAKKGANKVSRKQKQKSIEKKGSKRTEKQDRKVAKKGNLKTTQKQIQKGTRQANPIESQSVRQKGTKRRNQNEDQNQFLEASQKVGEELGQRKTHKSIEKGIQISMQEQQNSEQSAKQSQKQPENRVQMIKKVQRNPKPHNYKLKRIDSISSIRQEKEYFDNLEQLSEDKQEQEQENTVFKKILHDYQIYKDKKMRANTSSINRKKRK